MGVSKSKEANGDNNNGKVDEHRDWLHTTPSWCGGNMGIGTRLVDSYSMNSLDEGASLAYRVTNRLPIPRDQVWSVFSNFIEFSQQFDASSKHESGNDNEIGEIISFAIDYSKYGMKDTNENRMKQELTIRDNNNYVFQISMPQNGSLLFAQHRYTVRLYEDQIMPLKRLNSGNNNGAAASEQKNNEADNNNNGKNGCLLMCDMEVMFAKDISSDIRNIALTNLTNGSHLFAKRIFDIAFDKNGTHFEGNVNVKVPIDWCFKFLSDWKELGWVMSANKDTLVIHDKDVREFEILGGNGITVLERASICDNINHIFEYQVLNGQDLMPLRDTIKLTKVNDNETNFKSKISIYPRPTQNADELKKRYQYVLNTAMEKFPTVIVAQYENSLKK